VWRWRRRRLLHGLRPVAHADCIKWTRRGMHAPVETALSHHVSPSLAPCSLIQLLTSFIFHATHSQCIPKKGWTKKKLLKLPSSVSISDKVVIKDIYISTDPAHQPMKLYEQEMGEDTPLEVKEEWRRFREEVHKFPGLDQYAIFFDKQASRHAFACELDNRMLDLDVYVGESSDMPGAMHPGIARFAPLVKAIQGRRASQICNSVST
jgi:hypothetical protein